MDMKNKGLLIGSISLVVGAVGGYFTGRYVTKKKCDAELDEKVNAQVAEVKEMLKHYYCKDTGEHEEEGTVEAKEDIGQDESPRISFREPDQNPQVCGVSSECPAEPQKRSTTNDRTTSDGSVSLIEDDEFDTEFDDYCEWVLWTDGVITADDPLTEEIDEETINALLPSEWKSYFGWKDKYDGVLYFRNTRDKVDICVRKEEDSFRDWMRQMYPTFEQ